MLAYAITLGIFFGIYALMTMGLNFHFGFTGIINFGHVAFFAVGAYSSALLVMAGVPFVLGITVATLLAAAVAWPIGLMALRLRIEYFAIATLGFSEIVRTLIIGERWLTHGDDGISGIPNPFAFLGTGMEADLAYLGLVIAANLLALWVMYRIVHSPFGRMVQAIRDDEEAVRALGKEPATFKVRVLMIGAAFAGLAGALYAHYITFISPGQFEPLVTFYIWTAMIMGGAGRVGGAFVGSALLVLFLEGSRFLRDVVPFISDVRMASLRLAAIGLALILFMLYRPEGLLKGYSK